MKYKEVKELVASLKYKPGTTFTLYNTMITAHGQDMRLAIKMTVANVWDPTETTHLDGWLVIADNWERPRILKEIWARICDMEEHESQEFFQVDGKCFVDPHPEMSAEQREKEKASYFRDKQRRKDAQEYMAQMLARSVPVKGDHMELRPHQKETANAVIQMQNASMLRFLEDKTGGDDVIAKMVAEVEKAMQESGSFWPTFTGYMGMDVALPSIAEMVKEMTPPPLLEATKMEVLPHAKKGFSNKPYERFRKTTRRH